MIISSGYGYLTGVIGFTCLVLTEFLTEGIFHDTYYYQKHGWPKLLALWTAAAIVWPLGRGLNQQKQKELFDPWNGVESIMSLERRNIVRHTFFFIAMEYWAYIFVLFGIVSLFIIEEA